VIWFLLAFQLTYKDQLEHFLYLGTAQTFFVILIITTIISSVSFYLLEKPINSLKDRFFPVKSL
jgi:peptidoglycan/LPS O-acetylase OafA/YrhL